MLTQPHMNAFQNRWNQASSLLSAHFLAFNSFCAKLPIIGGDRSFGWHVMALTKYYLAESDRSDRPMPWLNIDSWTGDSAIVYENPLKVET